MRPAPPRSGNRKAAFFAPKVGEKTQVMNAQWQSMPDFDFLSLTEVFSTCAQRTRAGSVLFEPPLIARVWATALQWWGFFF